MVESTTNAENMQWILNCLCFPIKNSENYYLFFSDTKKKGHWRLTLLNIPMFMGGKLGGGDNGALAPPEKFCITWENWNERVRSYPQRQKSRTFPFDFWKNFENFPIVLHHVPTT